MPRATVAAIVECPRRMRVRIGMRALFAIPLGGIWWAPWSYRHRRDAAAVKCSEGVRGGWSGRTRRSPSLLLAIYGPLSLLGLCRRAPLLLAINVSRSRRSAASIRLARRATLTDAVALETRAAVSGVGSAGVAGLGAFRGPMVLPPLHAAAVTVTMGILSAVYCNLS